VEIVIIFVLPNSKEMTNINNITKSEIIELAKTDLEVNNILGGLESIAERSIEDLRAILKMFVMLNSEVSACFDKNGF
jgi:hypothetical protein